MKRVFICSPYRGDTEENEAIARSMCLMAIKEGYAPFAPHLLYTQFLCEDDADERAAGIRCGLQFLGKCDAVWQYDCVPTEGMELELRAAELYELPVHKIDPILFRLRARDD